MDFEVKDIQLKVEKDPENSDKFRLSLNGQNIIDRFKQKYQDVKYEIVVISKTYKVEFVGFYQPPYPYK